MDGDSGLSVIRMLFAFSVVLTLIAGFAWFLKYVHNKGFSFSSCKERKSRLKIQEAIPIDAKRRLVIVSCDDKEHLLLLGQSNDLIIAKHINKNHKTPVL